MPPKVTLVSSCYNHSRYIIDHLESVRRQDYPNIEHIIIDDASTDDSASLIEDWIESTGHSCVFIRNERNIGLCATLNKALQISTGDFWANVGTDDILPVDRTTIMSNFLRDNPNELMVAGDAAFINEEGDLFEFEGERYLFGALTNSDPLYREEYLGTFRGNFINCHIPTWMIRRSTFDIVGGFNEELMTEDWDLWLRISDRRRIPFIMKRLMFYRRHGSNISGITHRMAWDRVRLRLGNYRAAKRHVERDLLRRIMIGEFHEFVSLPRSLSNLMMFLKSPARWIALLGIYDYLKNATKARL